jgi:ABC-2 type transport system ATP-binding protein
MTSGKVDAQPEILIEGLSKTYRTRIRRGLFRSELQSVDALCDVQMAIRRGEIFGLLGPNGAGKTTLIKCLTTLLLPTSGDAWLHGYHIVRDDNAVRASVGCMLMGERGLYWKLTGRENLEFFGALYHLPADARRRRATAILELLGLVAMADRTVETYSSGQKMMLAFGKALVNDAPVLVLDEPTNTLDVPSARELRAIVRRLNQQGKTVLYTTHIMSEAETLCDRVAIVDRGRVIAEGSVPALKASLGRERVTHVEGVISTRASQAVEKLGGVTKVVVKANDGLTHMTVVSADGPDQLPRLIETLLAQQAVIQRIAPEEVTLEDVFMAKTGRSLADDTRVR